MERTSDYWFMIEPYVHINIANGYMLLYNTLDKETIISNNEKVINLLEELLQDENCGVTILKNEQYAFFPSPCHTINSVLQTVCFVIIST